MKTQKIDSWLSVYQYAKKVGKSKSQIYLDIRLGKIPKDRFRIQKIEVDRIQIKE